MFSIKLVNDDYTLPPEYENMLLVSSMYHIRASDTLPAPVRIWMEHCAVVEEDNDLIFMVAHGEPPYQFIPYHGGVFPQGEFYGEIELDKFSIFSIFRRRRRSIRLAVQIAYCKDAHFIATKNLEPHIATVKKEYDGADFDSYSMKCPSSTNEIVLSIPKATGKGWVIEPVFSPAKITMDTISNYQPGKLIPNIKLPIMWEGRGSPKRGKVKIGVKGGDLESFLLTCKHHCDQLPTAYGAESVDMALPQYSRGTSRLSSLSSDGTPTSEPVHQRPQQPRGTGDVSRWSSGSTYHRPQGFDPSCTPCHQHPLRPTVSVDGSPGFGSPPHPQHQLAVSPSSPSLQDVPTLPLLQRFPKLSGEPINIIERIGTKNRCLCIQILKDECGSVTNCIEAKHHCDPYRVTQEVFQRWLEKEQRTWAELVTALKEIELGALAKEIEDNLHPFQ